MTNLHRSSQNFLILISQFQSLENFSLLFNKSSDFSLFIETTIKLNYNKYFQTQENRFEFAKKNTLTEWQITLIIWSGIIIICGILFLMYNLNFFILNKFLVYEEYISLQFSFVFLIISNINYKKLNIYEFNFIYTYISIL